MTERDVTEQTPAEISDTPLQSADQRLKRPYQRPRLTELGPIVQATLGPTPDFGESSPAGNNFRIR